MLQFSKIAEKYPNNPSGGGRLTDIIKSLFATFAVSGV